jgi:hypothetical protein
MRKGQKLSERDWTALKLEFIASNVSLRRFAEQKGIAWNTLRPHAKKGDWRNARDQYRAKVEQEAAQKTVQKVSDELSDRRKLAMNVVDGMVKRGWEQLVGKKQKNLETGMDEFVIEPSMRVHARDLLEAVKLALVISGEPVVRTEVQNSGAMTLQIEYVNDWREN